MKTPNNQGFALLEVFVMLVFVSIVGFVGYSIAHTKSVHESAVITPAKTVSVPAKITSKLDVSNTATALDQTPIDTSLDPAQLDNAINSLL